MDKKNVMLMVPLLHQGGFERICVMTAHMLKEKCNLCLVIFSDQDRFYSTEGIEVINLNLGSRPGKLGKVVNVFKRIAAVKKLKKQRNTQITYSFGSTANIVNALSKVKDQIWLGMRGYDVFDNPRTMRLFCKHADMVICCAKVMSDDVERLYHPKRSVCLYNPCDMEQIGEQSRETIEEHTDFFRENRPIVATMGREDDVKGYWHLIKAFSLVCKEIPDAGLMIIGDGDFSEYEKLAAELHISDRVLFTGVQKNPFRYLKYASVYALTSNTEGFPNAMVEAMALGVPVVSVNCKTGPAEILLEDYRQAADQHRVYRGEYGVLAPVLNPVKNLDADVIEEEEKVLAELLLEQLSEKENLSERRARAQKRSETFSKEEYVRQLMGYME